MVESWLFKRVNHEVNFLLLKRTVSKGGFWQPVAGRVEEADETPLAAAKREIGEETGIDAAQLYQFGGIIHEFSVTKHYLTGEPVDPINEIAYAFEAHDAICNLSINPDNEHEAYGWFSYEEAMNKLKWTDNKEALRKLYEQLK